MSSSNRQTLAISAAIAILLLAVYLLSYSGTFTSDDEQLLAGGAQTFALTRELAVMQLYGNSRLQGNFQQVDPGLSVLGSLVYEMISTTEWGSVQAMFLLTPLWTAATAVLIFLLGQRWGYSPRLAIWPALFYGLGSMAWPYAKTFFRDPLAALFVAGAWLCFELAAQNPQPGSKLVVHWGALLVLWVGGVLSKNIVIPLILLMVIMAIVRHAGDRTREPLQWRRQAAIVTFFGAACLLLLAGPHSPALFRASIAYLVAFATWVATISHAGFGSAVLGALVSPGKGLIVFAPFTVLAVLSWMVPGRHRWERLLAPTAYLVVIVIAQALFYDRHWTNPQWGARFLLPALPGLAVATLPGLRRIEQQSKRAASLVGLGALGAGMLTQLPGVLIAPTAYSAIVLNQDIHAYEGLAIWDPWHSAMIGHWRLALSGSPWAFAWVRIGSHQPWLALLMVAGLALLVLYAVRLLRSVKDRPGSWTQALGGFMTLLGLCLLAPPATLSMYQSDPAYCAGQPAYRQAVHYLNEQRAAGDLVVVQGYLDPIWHCYFNFGRPPSAWVGLPTEDRRAKESSLDDPFSQPGMDADLASIRLFESAPARFNRLWFVGDLRGRHAANEGGLAQWLGEHYQLMEQREFGSVLYAQIWSLN